LKKALRYIFPIVLIIFLACTGAKENAVLEKIPVKEIKQKVNDQFKKIESIEAEGTIAFDSPDMSNSGYIELSLKKPDSIYFKIEGPFGIDVASALITRKDFVYYNVQENKVIMGPTTAINIGAILRIKVSFDELINSFSGSFYFPDEDSDSIDAASENNSYVLQIKKDFGKKKYLIEPQTYTVNNYSVYNNKGKIILEVDYSKFETESTPDGTFYFPDQITIHRPDVKQTVWLSYESKEINKKDLSFKIKYPKSAKIVLWN
jgi:outer membrane lipoprotein-sorting protein